MSDHENTTDGVCAVWSWIISGGPMASRTGQGGQLTEPGSLTLAVQGTDHESALEVIQAWNAAIHSVDGS